MCRHTIAPLRCQVPALMLHPACALRIFLSGSASTRTGTQIVTNGVASYFGLSFRKASCRPEHQPRAAWEEYLPGEYTVEDSLSISAGDSMLPSAGARFLSDANWGIEVWQVEDVRVPFRVEFTDERSGDTFVLGTRLCLLRKKIRRLCTLACSFLIGELRDRNIVIFGPVCDSWQLSLILNKKVAKFLPDFTVFDKLPS
ncbi:hypothetical protein GGX14DRAFT_451244 [Mycena pura]|uniref:Uncharacterized protein n=1 Tax=Mycena pura TaxID=153505 RepID=A0AAD6VHS3_9AGAR|nr:hypothetical protein GGX14DRAFT_451244 [Mycena pura]